MMPKSDDQMLTKSSQGPRFARSDIRYWENAVFQRVRSRKGKKDRSKHFSVQIQFAGRRAEFSLGTANKAVAARKAREIHEHLKVNGWTATLAKFKSPPEPKDNGAIRTVGELIAAIEGTTASRGRTLREYIRSFRRIVASAFGIDDPKKYDYRKGGRSGWIERIDSIPLEKITPQVVQSWKVDFLSRAGQNPAKQRTARISVNSALRGARSLFSPTRLKFITLPLGFTSPFASVALEPRQAMSYRSFFDIKLLVANAQSQLSRSDPEAFKAFLLASMVGLRRAEIDQLEWTAFDWQLEKLHIGVTEHFAVKSQGSIGDVDLDRELMEVFKNFTRSVAALSSSSLASSQGPEVPTPITAASELLNASPAGFGSTEWSENVRSTHCARNSAVRSATGTASTPRHGRFGTATLVQRPALFG
jgi:hypothetical protein